MRRFLFTTAGLMLCIMTLALAGEEVAWFDMTNCEMCQNWAGDDKMMHEMKWEQHKISDGMMSVTTVSPKYMEKYVAAQKNAEALGQKLMSGYQAKLCGCCQAMGATMAHGATMENVMLENGSVMLLTASDEAVVKDIHKIVERNKVEMAKMMGQEGHGQPADDDDDAHAGHDH